MKATVRICQDVPVSNLRRLAASVVLQALEDAKKVSIEKQLDAVMWLVSEDMAWWCEWAGIPFVDPVQLVTSGKARNSQTRRRNGRNERQQHLATV